MASSANATAPSSLFRTTLSSLRVAGTGASAAVAADGGSGVAPAALPAVWSSDLEALKASLPGSLLKLMSGKWNYVPVSATESCIVLNGSRPPKLRTIEVLGGASKDKLASDLASTVKEVYTGVLDTDEGQGSAAASLKVFGMPATMTLASDPAGGNAITHARLAVQGMEQAPQLIDTALTQLGCRARSWAGGKQAALLLGNPAHPTLVSTNTSVIDLTDLVGGGSLAARLVATICILAGDPRATQMGTAPAAAFIAGFCGLQDRVDALSVVIAAGPHIAAAVAAGTPASAAQTATLTARTALLTAMGNMIQEMPHAIITATSHKIGELTAAGYTVHLSGIGSIVLAVLAEHEANLPPSPAPKPSSAESTSPRDLIIAQQAAQLKALRGGADSPPAAAPQALCGMEFLRPAPVVSFLAGTRVEALPLTNLELFVSVGEQLAHRVALTAGNTDPVIILSGSGAGSCAIELAADFATILARARSLHPDDPRIQSHTAPMDVDAAGSRLRVVLRLLQLPAGSAPAHAAAQLAPPPRARSDNDNPTVVSESAAASRIARAGNAAVLNLLVSDEQYRKAAAHAALEDPLAEARRNIDLHGTTAALYLCSSGETNGKLSGPLHPRIAASRTGWVGYVQRELEKFATSSRVKAAAAETLTLRASIVSVDMTWAPLITRFGGIKPTVGEWRSGRLVAKPTQGRWGAIDGPSAYADRERAAVAFAPLLITVMHSHRRRTSSSRADYGVGPICAGHSWHHRRSCSRAAGRGLRENLSRPPCPLLRPQPAPS